jgi:hypothetical protein
MPICHCFFFIIKGKFWQLGLKKAGRFGNTENFGKIAKAIFQILVFFFIFS